MGRNFRELAEHIILAAFILWIWVLATWVTHGYLLPHFPLSGMSSISFKIAEILFDAGTLWIIIRTFIPKQRPPTGRWWA